MMKLAELTVTVFRLLTVSQCLGPRIRFDVFSVLLSFWAFCLLWPLLTHFSFSVCFAFYFWPSYFARAKSNGNR